MPVRKKKQNGKIPEPTPEKQQDNQSVAPITPVAIDPNMRASLTAVAGSLTEQQAQAIVGDLSQLTAQTKEYLGTFIVLGYTLDGLPIQIIYGKTQLELDALNAALSRFLISQGRLIGRRPPEAPPEDEEQDPHDEPH